MASTAAVAAVAAVPALWYTAGPAAPGWAGLAITAAGLGLVSVSALALTKHRTHEPQTCKTLGQKHDDATAQHLAEADGDADRRAIEAVERAAPLGIGIVTMDRTIVHVNDRLCRMLGRRRNELIGRNARILYATDAEYERVGGEHYDAIDRTGTALLETTFARSDGSTFDVFISSAALDLADRSKGVTFTVLDISERRRREVEIRRLNEELEQRVADRTHELEKRVEQVERLNRGMLNLADDLHLANTKLEALARDLQESNRELESFAYSVSHDLRAPLRHISGFVDLLMQDSADALDEKGSRRLDVIAEAAARMARLIDDLLEFSRAGRVELVMAPIDMDRLVAEVVEETRIDAGERDIEWLIGALPPARGDRATIRQVISNLLDNAVKYTRTTPNARIEIGATPTEDPDTITYFVRDNGVGFDPRYAHKLFGVFQRLHRVEEFEGTGIGLANVRRIVSRHGGRTRAEGEIGLGAALFFTLPRSSKAAGGSFEADPGPRESTP